MNKVEFVKFRTKARDNRTYALDSKGVEWASMNGIDWESSEAVPRHIRQGLTAGQVVELATRRGTAEIL